MKKLFLKLFSPHSHTMGSATLTILGIVFVVTALGVTTHNIIFGY